MKLFNRKFVYQRPEGDDASGGGAAPDAETQGTNNDSRVAALNAIMDKNDVARADEFMDVGENDQTVAFVPPTLPDAETVEGEAVSDATTQTDDPAAIQPDAVAPKLFKIKVNGKELELTEEELISRAQKVESADEYLRTAKESAPRAQTPAPVQAGPTEEELQRQQDEEDKALARALQVGTEEEAVAAIRKVRASRVGPSINLDDISRTVDGRLAFNTAIDQFSKDFQDIWVDPVLKDLAFRKDRALIAAGDKRPYLERYTEIGTELRTWVSGIAPKAPPPSDGLDDKTARKAAAPQLPVTASGKQTPKAAAEDKEESASDVIANMAKIRGGPQWMRS